MSGAEINATDTLIARTQQGAIATVVRTKATDQTNDIWLRAMILAPSASTSLSASILGDQDMTVMRVHFAKPNAAVAMTFSEDPQMGHRLREIHRLGDHDAVDDAVRDAHRLAAVTTPA